MMPSNGLILVRGIPGKTLDVRRAMPSKYMPSHLLSFDMKLQAASKLLLYIPLLSISWLMVLVLSHIGQFRLLGTLITPSTISFSYSAATISIVGKGNLWFRFTGLPTRVLAARISSSLL